MDFRESFEKFKESKWVVPAYIVLVIVVNVGLVFLNQCLATILIPITMFAIPYYMGEKRFRFFLLLGVIVIFANSAIVGLLYSEDVMNYRVPVQTSSDENKTITNGIFTPTVGSADTVFYFTLTITTNETDMRTILVYAHLSEALEYKEGSGVTYEMTATDDSDFDASDGKEYHLSIVLPKGLYATHFSADVNGTSVDTLYYDTLSDAYLKVPGPYNADYWTIYVWNFQLILTFMIFTTILFFIFVMMYWWVGKSRIEKTKWDTRLREAGELEVADAKIPDFECTNCGRAVHDDAIRCPHCGAIFEEGEEEEMEEEPEPEE